jgi:hypothetical protein
MQLKLDPAILAMAAKYVDEQMDPTRLRPAIGSVNYFGPSLPKLPTPAQAAAGAPGTDPAGPHPAVDPKSVPAIPPPQPLVPAGKGPSKPKGGELGDIAEAIAAIPAIESGIEGLKSQVKGKVSSDWGKLKPGEKAAVVTTLVSIGLPALGAAASDPGARDFLLSQINGKILPVPKVPWLNLEVNTEKGSLMVGMHVDVGQLLPPSLGFGPGSPTAIGGPPAMAGQRTPASPDSTPMPSAEGEADLPGRIRTQAGHGAALPRSVRQRFEAGLGADLTEVRVHTGAEADRLARAMNATAFTTGQDIFFRAGAFAPGTEAGLRLLAHETTHTVQQASGPVSGIPVGGVAVSDPHDRFEQAARRSAERLVRMPAEPLVPARPRHGRVDPSVRSPAEHHWDRMSALPPVPARPPVRSLAGAAV